jgi:hypothetical protein
MLTHDQIDELGNELCKVLYKVEEEINSSNTEIAAEETKEELQFQLAEADDILADLLETFRDSSS